MLRAGENRPVFCFRLAVREVQSPANIQRPDRGQSQAVLDKRRAEVHAIDILVLLDGRLGHARICLGSSQSVKAPVTASSGGAYKHHACR